MAFASWSRVGDFIQCHQVCQGLVDCALWDVVQVLVYAGVGDPRRAGGSTQQALDLPLHWILQRYKQQDPHRNLNWQFQWK
eukprot:4046287-Ditylum_brightwellii.AAC.1